MLNTKKTICQNNHSSEVLYSGFVTAVTPKPSQSLSALDAEADVLNQPQYIRPERLRPHRRFWQLGY